MTGFEAKQCGIASKIGMLSFDCLDGSLAGASRSCFTEHIRYSGHWKVGGVTKQAPFVKFIHVLADDITAVNSDIEGEERNTLGAKLKWKNVGLLMVEFSARRAREDKPDGSGRREFAQVLRNSVHGGFAYAAEVMR